MSQKLQFIISYMVAMVVVGYMVRVGVRKGKLKADSSNVFITVFPVVNQFVALILLLGMLGVVTFRLVNGRWPE